MEGGKCGNMLRRNWLQPVPREAGGLVAAEGGGTWGRGGGYAAVGLDIPAAGSCLATRNPVPGATSNRKRDCLHYWPKAAKRA